MIKATRVAVRGTLLLFHLLVGVCLAVVVLSPRGFRRLPRWSTIRWWNRRLCRILQLRIQVSGRPVAGTALLVANHISWLDVVALLAVAQVRFLAKIEIRSWLLLGWLSQCAGTLFIRRGGGAQRATEQITWSLRQGESVLVFPEGTSTDGRHLKHFHARIYQAALRVHRPVQSCAIAYLTSNNSRHPVAPFIGEDTFLCHLLAVLAEPEMRVLLTFHEPLSWQGQSRDTLARETRHQIAATLGLEEAKEPKIRWVG